MRCLTIIGSAHPKGNTVAAVHQLATQLPMDIVNLNDYDISYYDYEHKNKEDDFLPLLRKFLAGYDLMLIATPVYWYSMSAIMKNFFDRITDLLTIEKDLGRQLRGKSMAVLNSSNGSNLGDAFWLPFSESAEYLGMNYLGNVHTFEGKNNSLVIRQFAKELQQNWAAALQGKPD